MDAKKKNSNEERKVNKEVELTMPDKTFCLEFAKSLHKVLVAALLSPDFKDSNVGGDDIVNCIHIGDILKRVAEN